MISFGLVSCSLKNSPVLLGEPLLATISGSILGPFAINLLSCERSPLRRLCLLLETQLDSKHPFFIIQVLPKDWDAGEEATVEFHEILIWIVRVVISIGVLFAAATCPQVGLLSFTSQGHLLREFSPLDFTSQQYPISKGTPVSRKQRLLLSLSVTMMLNCERQ